MKVKDLISELKKLDQELDIVYYTEDENSSRVFNIESIESKDCELVRSEDGVAGLKFERNSKSIKIALLTITSDI
jgi:hypothetical protein